jgi:uncharacterized protein YggT (Ycf19 family)
MDRREEVRIARQPGVERHERVVEDVGLEKRRWLSKVTRLIWLFAALLEAGIGLRVVLRLIAANPANPFASFIYRITAPFLVPFADLTVTPSVGGIVIELSSMFAMVVYYIAAWALVRLIWTIFNPARARQVAVYERDDGRSPRG